MGPADVYVVETVPMGRMAVDVKTKCEGEAVVGDSPALLGEPHLCFLRMYVTDVFGEWSECPLHKEGSEKGEKHHPRYHIVRIVKTNVIYVLGILSLDKVL